MVSSSPATTCALVTTSPLVGDPAAPLLDLAGTRPLPSRSTRGPCGRPRPRSWPRAGGRDWAATRAAQRRRVRRIGDGAAPRRERAGCVGVRSSRNPIPRAPRHRAGQPFAVASDGMIIQRAATRRPCRSPRPRAVPARQRRAVTRERCTRRRARAERLAERRGQHEEEHRDRHPVLGAGTAERGDDVWDPRRARRSPSSTWPTRRTQSACGR